MALQRADQPQKNIPRGRLVPLVWREEHAHPPRCFYYSCKSRSDGQCFFCELYFLAIHLARLKKEATIDNHGVEKTGWHICGGSCWGAYIQSWPAQQCRCGVCGAWYTLVQNLKSPGFQRSPFDLPMEDDATPKGSQDTKSKKAKGSQDTHASDTEQWGVNTAEQNAQQMLKQQQQDMLVQRQMLEQEILPEMLKQQQQMLSKEILPQILKQQRPMFEEILPEMLKQQQQLFEQQQQQCHSDILKNFFNHVDLMPTKI